MYEKGKKKTQIKSMDTTLSVIQVTNWLPDKKYGNWMFPVTVEPVTEFLVYLTNGIISIHSKTGVDFINCFELYAHYWRPTPMFYNANSFSRVGCRAQTSLWNWPKLYGCWILDWNPSENRTFCPDFGRHVTFPTTNTKINAIVR